MTLRVSCGALRRPALALLALVTAALTVAAPVPATAEPGDHAISLRSLGLGTALQFPGRVHEITLTLPILPGLAPAAIVGTVQLPPTLARGTLEARSGQRLLDRVNLPSDPRAPIRISLAGAEVKGSAVAVTLSSSLLPEPGICPEDWTGQPMTLTDAAVTYFGEEAQPATVAEFLPAVLDRLTVYLPATPSKTESAAALQLVTAVTARYANRPVAVDVRRFDSGATLPDHPPAFLERQIAIRESADPGLRLAGGPAPLLTVSGDAKSMPVQMRLLTSDLARAALGTDATAVGLPAAPQLAPDSTTLMALGQTQLSATSIGYVRVAFTIDQTRLGRPSQNVRINLYGNHTPMPQTLNGQLSVAVGDRQIAAWPVDPSGHFDQWVSIPNQLLSRTTTVTVTLQQAGLTHGCGLEQPVTLTVDPEGEVQSTLSAPPEPGGLGALPQALLPRVQVGLQTQDFTDTVRAARVLIALQRLTAVPLRPELVSFGDAAGGTLPAVLIAPGGAVPDSITLPLARSGDALTVYGDDAYLKTTIDLSPPLNFGSLQATWNNQRTLVVATSTEAPEHLDRLLEWLVADPDRSFQLSGPVLLQAGDREPEFFDPAATSEEFAAPAPDDDIPLARTLTVIASALLLGGLIAGIAILVQRRRSR